MTYEDYSKACVSYVENLMVKNQSEQNLNQLGNLIAEYKKSPDPIVVPESKVEVLDKELTESK